MTWLQPTADFPHELLPYGVFDAGSGAPRIGVAVGQNIVDLASAVAAGAINAVDKSIAGAPTLNPLIDAGIEVWTQLRSELQELLAPEAAPDGVKTYPMAEVEMLLPIEVADYVDFYSSVEHATNLGKMFRPNSDPLLPNWRHIPIGYHGRAGTVYVSGTDIQRPLGQRKPPTADSPTFGPSQRLDIELEMGAILRASVSGHPVTTETAAAHIFGLVLVNDWSARDIQAWEYQPLGPFLGKSFATSISPWVIPYISVEPYLVAAPDQSPTPLPHLQDPNGTSVDAHLEISIQTSGSDEDVLISTTNSKLVYWTFAQQIAHLTSNGAPLRTGDLIASGTISGTEPDAVGSLIELSWNGRDTIEIGDSTRTFLEDGDTVTLRGWLGSKDGPTLGATVGTITPAADRS